MHFAPTNITTLTSPTQSLPDDKKPKKAEFNAGIYEILRLN